MSSDGTRFRMPAMHLVTKELREWLWITIWWSDKPDEDFGADRPDEITKLGGPWRNYKMNVVVSYEEKDPDPRGGFDGSLGDALAATYDGRRQAHVGVEPVPREGRAERAVELHRLPPARGHQREQRVDPRRARQVPAGVAHASSARTSRPTTSGRSPLRRSASPA